MLWLQSIEPLDTPSVAAIAVVGMTVAAATTVMGIATGDRFWLHLKLDTASGGCEEVLAIFVDHHPCLHQHTSRKE